MLGVSDWLTSRMGTRSFPTYTFRELGSGLIAASSTWAVAARNFGLAFMGVFLRRNDPHQVPGTVSPKDEEQAPLGPLTLRSDYNPPRYEPGASAHQHGRAADPHLGGAGSGRAGS